MIKNLIGRAPILGLLLALACAPFKPQGPAAVTPTPVEATDTPEATEPERTPRPETPTDEPATATPAEPTQPEEPTQPDTGCNGTDDCDDDDDGYTEDGGDCNDADRTINPNAPEICDDDVDQDCDGEDGVCPVDEDGDGFPPATDCNDENANVHPGAAELCDEYDNDCDGGVNDNDPCEPDSTPLPDRDGDGISVSYGDCDDTDRDVHPGATEKCGDDIDQDCNGLDQSCYDDDGDGDDYTENGGDCDDGDPTINPGARETAINGVDENCSGEDAGLKLEAFHGQIGERQDGSGVTMPSGYLLEMYFGGDSDNGSRSVQYTSSDLPTAADPQDRVFVNLIWEDVAGSEGGHSWVDVFTLYDANGDGDKELASADGCDGWSFWQTAEEGAALNGTASMWYDTRDMDCRVYLSGTQPTGSDVIRFTFVRNL